jgi:predicted AlkP superfamily phosphohydrolase/phosphomutase
MRPMQTPCRRLPSGLPILLRAPAIVLLPLLAFAAACAREPAAPARPPHPVVLIGVDGGEWSVVRDLWAQGRLPALKALAERGVSATLRTDYGKSPVIWTTLATGRRPREHGITDFVVPTPEGDVPVSSTLRRVPALWTMATAAGRRVGVVSWWASWPAEAVDGVVVSDRALLPVPDAVSPPEFAPRFAELRRTALASPLAFGGNPAAAERDQVTGEVSVALAGERLDLLLVYYRAVDIASHLYWRHFRPPEGAAPAPGDAALAREVPRTYEATDAAIGRLLAAMPDANVFVVSDHGFHRTRREEAVITLAFDRVLARLGYLAGEEGKLDWARTRVYPWSAGPSSRVRPLRFALAGREPGGRVLPAERQAIREALARDLARVTWDDGRPAFRVREPRPGEARGGAELVVGVLDEGASKRLRLDGNPWDGVVEDVSFISGTHGRQTHGFFFAAGPDIRRGAAAEGIHIHDVTPTVLHALGLPVAEDFAGRAWSELFAAEWQRRYPLRRIRTWGEPRDTRAARSAADAELLEELRALGYLR